MMLQTAGRDEHLKIKNKNQSIHAWLPAQLVREEKAQNLHPTIAPNHRAANCFPDLPATKCLEKFREKDMSGNDCYTPEHSAA